MKNNTLCPICNKSWDRCKCGLGLEIGSKEQQEWKKIATDSEILISTNKRSIELHEIILTYARNREKEEEEKFKNSSKI